MKIPFLNNVSITGGLSANRLTLFGNLSSSGNITTSAVNIGTDFSGGALTVFGNISSNATATFSNLTLSGGTTLTFGSRNISFPFNSTLSHDTSDNLIVNFGGGSGKSIDIRSSGTTVVLLRAASNGHTITGNVTLNSGNLAVNGNETITGTLAVSGLTTVLAITPSNIAAGSPTSLIVNSLSSQASTIALSSNWNNAGTTYTALSVNVNDMASDSNSLLADLQVGGASRLNLSKAGLLTVSGNISTSGIIYATGGNSNLWNTTYSTVFSNSASWEESADILPTVTNYLSTNNVFLLSATVLRNLSVVGTVYSSNTANVMAIYSQTIGDNSNNTFTINHNLGTKDVSVAVYEIASNVYSYPKITLSTSNSITLNFSFIPNVNSYRVTIIGSVPSNQINAYGQIYTYYTTATGFGDITTLSAKWTSTFGTVSSLSANWNNAGAYTLTATNFNITRTSSWAVDTSSSSLIASLPSSPSTGTCIRFLDAKKTWATNNFLILRSGEVIESIADDLNCDISGYSFEMTYVGGSVGWRVT